MGDTGDADDVLDHVVGELQIQAILGIQHSHFPAVDLGAFGNDFAPVLDGLVT